MTDRTAKFRDEIVVSWRFAESEEDGEAWLRNPVKLQAYVDYESRSGADRSNWRRVMLVTGRWLEAQVQGVRKGNTGPLWAALPSMIVVPDAPPEELRAIVDAVIRQGGFDMYSTLLPPPE